MIQSMLGLDTFRVYILYMLGKLNFYWEPGCRVYNIRYHHSGTGGRVNNIGLN